MATNNSVYRDQVNEVLSAVKADYTRTLGDESISKNTKHTKCYNLRKEIKRLTVIESLLGVITKEAIEALMKNKNFKESLTSIMNPEEGGTKITVNVGDTILKILQENAGAKDVYNRAIKYATANGMKLDKDGNTFVRA